jgi:hypothetical protein
MRFGRSAAVAWLALVMSAASAAQTQTDSVRAAVARLEVRAEPRESSPVIGLVSYGDVMPIVRAEAGPVPAGWQHVSVFASKLSVGGYVRSTDVAPAPPAAVVNATLRTSSSFGIAAATNHGVSVAIDGAGKTHWIAAVPTRAVPAAGASPSLAALAASPKLIDAIAGATDASVDPATPVLWTWLVSPSSITTTVPAQVVITVLYGDVRGVAPDDVIPIVVRLPSAGADWRAVAAARGRMDAPFREASDWAVGSALMEDVVAGQQPEGGAGVMKIRLAHALAAGNYAVILRPLTARPLAGVTVFAGSALAAGDSILFAFAWPFRVA